jgi:23S rRNA pseudouridine1911/1915/1917 synthase
MKNEKDKKQDEDIIDRSLDIIFQNENLLVINKPSNLTVNRSDTTNGDTLQDILDREFELSVNEEPEFIDRSGIVHRLDKETSGALIIAKNSSAFRNLQAQFKNREVEKEYIALAHGQIVPLKGEINAPVGRLPWNRKRFGVLAGGREAKTFYEVEKLFRLKDELFSYVRLYPKTGRTHQIRVHLKYINHPIFSDFLYAGRKTARNDRKLLERVFLHAEKINFKEPDSGEKISVKAKLPEDLTGLLEKLEQENII